MNVTQYYERVHEFEAMLSEGILSGKYAGQLQDFEERPRRDGSGEKFKRARWATMMSVVNEDRGSFGGQVTSMTVTHAARRMAEGTHRVATEDEIKQWHRNQVAQLEERNGAFLTAVAEGNSGRDAREKQAKIPPHLKQYIAPAKPVKQAD